MLRSGIARLLVTLLAGLAVAAASAAPFTAWP